MDPGDKHAVRATLGGELQKDEQNSWINRNNNQSVTMFSHFTNTNRNKNNNFIKSTKMLNKKIYNASKHITPPESEHCCLYLKINQII